MRSYSRYSMQFPILWHGEQFRAAAPGRPMSKIAMPIPERNLEEPADRVRELYRKPISRPLKPTPSHNNADINARARNRPADAQLRPERSSHAVAAMAAISNTIFTRNAVFR